MPRGRTRPGCGGPARIRINRGFQLITAVEIGANYRQVSVAQPAELVETLAGPLGGSPNRGRVRAGRGLKQLLARQTRQRGSSSIS